MSSTIEFSLHATRFDYIDQTNYIFSRIDIYLRKWIVACYMTWTVEVRDLTF